jgi:Xaa-Pro aminopeptidase
MTDTFLLAGLTRLNADLRHQVPVEMHDPLLFLDRGGHRLIVASQLEEARIRSQAACEEFQRLEDLGRERLARELGSRERADQRAMVSAVLSAGVRVAAVPSSFPLGMAREMEQAGVVLEIDDERFAGLRRRKSPEELEGVERAQVAADAAVQRVKTILRDARRGDDGALYKASAPITVDWLKREVRAKLAEHDALLDEFILSCGEHTAMGHHVGEGTLRADEPILVDLWPTDRASGCCTDMTRTFVVGEAPAWLAERHELCLAALDAVVPDLRPGARCEDLHATVCEIFEARGFRTPLSARPGETFLDGFPYNLGHGLGLELHEPPMMRQGDVTELVEGEVVAVEPALYEQGVGGVRIEDVFVITAAGARRLGRLDHDLAVK